MTARRVRELGQTVVMVTHDPVAASYADRVVFLADGRIVDELRDPVPDAVLDRMPRLGDATPRVTPHPDRGGARRHDRAEGRRGRAAAPGRRGADRRVPRGRAGRRQLALLRAVGATRRQVTRSVLAGSTLAGARRAARLDVLAAVGSG